MAKPVKHRGKWRIRWFDENDRRQSEVHEDYRVALCKQREHEVQTDQIRQGLRPREARDKTFNELCDYWIENRVPLKRSGKDDESVIRKHLRPAFGPMRVRDVGVEEGDADLRSHTELDPKTVSNHLTLLLSMLRLATSFKTPWILSVPRLKKPKTSLLAAILTISGPTRRSAGYSMQLTTRANRFSYSTRWRSTPACARANSPGSSGPMSISSEG